MILLEDDLSELLPFGQVSTTVRIILHLISFRQFSFMIYFIFIILSHFISFMGTYEHIIDQLPTSVAS